MFGENSETGYISKEADETSDEYRKKVDESVKNLLNESFNRVMKLLENKEKELRGVAKNLFYYDYLTYEEIDSIIRGKQLSKEKVREWTSKEQYLIKF